MENTISHLTDVELPKTNISPIVGVFGPAHNKPFLEAIEACSSTLPDAPAIAASSLFFASTTPNSFGLTPDEISAINLYTIECDFYKIFNQALRERDRKKLFPFFPYLKLLLLGLNKLPSYCGRLWRGVKLDLKDDYPEGKKFFWCSFSSCTVSLEVLESEQFCGKTGHRTIFCISAQKGKDIKMFSNFAEEGEVLLMPGYFVVKGVMEAAEGCTIIDLEELPSPFDIFIGFSTSKTLNITSISTTKSTEPVPIIIQNPTKTTQPVTSTPIETRQPVTTITPTLTKTLPGSINVKNIQLKYQFGSFGSDDDQFHAPYGIAIDANGNIVVADETNHRIQIFGPDGKFIRKFGSNGHGDGQFSCPCGVAIGANGNIVVTDKYNYRIQIFGPDGKFLWKFGSFGEKDDQFHCPRGVAIDANGNIVVADYNNHRIQIFGPDGKFILKFGSKGSRDSQLFNPFGVAIDANSNIVVAEEGNHRIQIFGPDGKFIQKFGSIGLGGGQFHYPRGVAIDSNGYIVVADYNKIQIFGPNGKLIMKFGSYGSDNGQFKTLGGVAIDSNGNIVVTDIENHRIQVFGEGKNISNHCTIC